MALDCTPAATADLVTGRSWGPSPECGAKIEIRRRNGTVLPATASTVTPVATQVARSSAAPRRRPALVADGRSLAGVVDVAGQRGRG